MGRSIPGFIAATILAFVPITASAAPVAQHGQAAAQQTACKVVYNHGILNAYSVGAEWTSNPCGASMQVKATCITLLTQRLYTRYSGHVKGLNIWDVASCDSIDAVLVGSIQFDRTGPWHVFWNA